QHSEVVELSINFVIRGDEFAVVGAVCGKNDILGDKSGVGGKRRPIPVYITGFSCLRS
ncbi:unnamed protein product, partial [Onchocerca ochengi]|uniref:Peptidase S1 domain-containing protein n=1 Tax=Onchocerca ochengi TaxID=42157 RepID=A0A182ETM7_ONCOC